MTSRSHEPVGRQAWPVASFWIVVLIGPPLGLLLMLLAIGAAPINVPVLLSGLVPAWFLGLLPASVVAAVDRWVELRGANIPRRLAWATLTGALTGLILLAPLYAAGLVHGFYPLILCLITALTALLCLGLHVLIFRTVR